MHSYLVCPSRFKLASYKCKSAKAPLDAVVCYSLACRVRAVSNDCHSLSVHGMSAYRCVYLSRILFKITKNDGSVNTAYLMLLYLRRKEKMCIVILSRNKKTCRVLVNSVHDTGTYNPPSPERLSLQ